MDFNNHYEWLDQHLDDFWKSAIGKSLSESYCAGIVSAHGDKCYGYMNKWEDAGIPFEHGVALYLLTHTNNFSQQVRKQADGGWVAPDDWVVNNYSQFKNFLAPPNSVVKPSKNKI